MQVQTLDSPVVLGLTATMTNPISVDNQNTLHLSGTNGVLSLALTGYRSTRLFLHGPVESFPLPEGLLIHLQAITISMSQQVTTHLYYCSGAAKSSHCGRPIQWDRAQRCALHTGYKFIKICNGSVTSECYSVD
jgi:hypothetical protein